jgi:NADH-quinone oxidoreductase subunit I
LKARLTRHSCGKGRTQFCQRHRRIRAQYHLHAPGEIDAEEDPDGAHVEKAPKEFDINMLRCIYCGLCEEVCPEEAIFLQDIFSTSGYSREEMINNKEKLYELGGTLPDQHYKWDKKKDAEEKGNPHH